MKRITLFLLVVSIVVNLFGFSVAFAETNSAYELVCNTVKQVYNVDMENYEEVKEDDCTIYCGFKGDML